MATATVPAAGFWEGPADSPTGGLEHGLARALAERFGLDDLKVLQVPFETLVRGDLAGADLALSQLTPTEAREADLDFSAPYLAAAPAILVRSGTEVRDLEAAQELRWAVRSGSTLAEILADSVRPTEPTVELADRQEAIDLLLAGDVEAVLLDLPVAVAIAEHSEGALDVAAQLSIDDDLAAALPDGSPNLEAVDAAIRALLADGTIDDLAGEWLGQAATAGVLDIPVIRTKEI